MVWISSALSFYLGMNENKASFSTFKAAVVVTELVQVIQLIITIVYWIALHEHMLQMIAPLNSALLYHLLVHIHWFPLTAITMCVFLSTNVFIPAHATYLFKLGVVYLPVNAFGTWQRGKPIYPFLPWTDYKTAVIGLVLFGAGMAAFYGVTWGVNKCQKRRNKVI